MLVVAAIALATIQAHAEQIGVTMATFDDNFLAILRRDIAESSKRLGVKVQIEDAATDVYRQLNQIENMIAARVDAIIVNPVDTDVTPKITRMVTAARIPLVYVNRKPADFDRLPTGVAVVASDDTEAGTLEARYVCRLLHGEGNILILMGDLSNEAARARTQAIQDVVATKECAGMTVIDKRDGRWSRTQGQDITANWLTAGRQFDAIIANDDEMAIGAINALKAARAWTPMTIVAGIDGTPDALASMSAGELKVTVFQNAASQAEGSITTAVKLVRGQYVGRFVNVPFELVTPDNVRTFGGRN